MIRAYIRVSHKTQCLDRQKAALPQYDKLYEDVVTGVTANRDGLNRLLADLRHGDTVVVDSIDRLGRSVPEISQVVKQIKDKGAYLVSIKESIDCTPKIGGLGSVINDLLVNILLSVAQFERERLLERIKGGIEIAKNKGVYAERTRKMAQDPKWQERGWLTKEKTEMILKMHAEGMKPQEIADHVGTTIRTVYRKIERMQIK